MGRKQNNERIVLPCKFGKLVCEVICNDDEYKEFAIDLYRNDGKVTQVCVVGTDEWEWHEPNLATPMEKKQHDMVHINYWDGEYECCCGQHHVEPYGDGWWGEETI